MAESRAATANTSDDENNVTIRIVILSHGNRSENDLYLVLTLDATVAELKERIRESLDQHPSPESQRLIYLGRPLVQGAATLRQTLRQDQRPANSSHVLHLVIRDTTTGFLATESPAQATAANISSTIPVPAPASAPPPAPSFPPDLHGQIEELHARLQAHQFELQRLHRQALMTHALQNGTASEQPVENEDRSTADQMRGVLGPLPVGDQIRAGTTPHSHDAAHSAPADPGAGVQRAPHGPMPTNMPRIPNISEPVNPPSNPTQGSPAQAGHATSLPPMQHATLPMPPFPPMPHMYMPQQLAGLPMPPQHMFMPHGQPAVNTTQVQETVGPNGQRIRTVISNNSLSIQATGSGVPNPFNRPASAPRTHPTTASDPAHQAANPAPPTVHVHAHATHVPLPINSMAIPFQMRPPHDFPAMVRNGHFNDTGSGTIVAGSVGTSASAWILSGPDGPRGFLFAPGHGYFTTELSPPSQMPVDSSSHNTTQTPPPTRPEPTPTTASNPPTQSTNPLQQTPVEDRDVAPHAPRQAAGPIVLQGNNAAQPQVPQARQVAEENEMVNFILNRGWLFMRLYLFIFVFSNSGTWRRIFMLGFAIIFCLLPRDNPITQTVRVLRRHFDDLIGPPTLEQAQPQVNNAQTPVRQNEAQAHPGHLADASSTGNAHPSRAGNSTAATTSSRSSMPTPEETARRLLDRERVRNPNPVLDLLARLEQASVLFLASLVPGVGERHVRARMDARRIVEAEERRLREAQESVASASLEQEKTSESKDKGSSAIDPPSRQESSNSSHAQASGSETPANQSGLRARSEN